MSGATQIFLVETHCDRVLNTPPYKIVSLFISKTEKISSTLFIDTSNFDSTKMDSEMVGFDHN